MEFLDPDHSLNIRDEEWRIYSKNPVSPPQFLTESSNVTDSMIVDGCYVAGEITHSILSQNVCVSATDQSYAIAWLWQMLRSVKMLRSSMPSLGKMQKSPTMQMSSVRMVKSKLLDMLKL